MRNNYCFLFIYCDNFRGSNQEKKQRTDTIDEAKKIKSYNVTMGNSPILISRY